MGRRNVACVALSAPTGLSNRRPPNDCSWPTAACQPRPPILRLADTGDRGQPTLSGHPANRNAGLSYGLTAPINDQVRAGLNLKRLRHATLK